MYALDSTQNFKIDHKSEMGKPKIKFLEDRKFLETSLTSEIFQTATQ